MDYDSGGGCTQGCIASTLVSVCLIVHRYSISTIILSKPPKLHHSSCYLTDWIYRMSPMDCSRTCLSSSPMPVGSRDASSILVSSTTRVRVGIKECYNCYVIHRNVFTFSSHILHHKRQCSSFSNLSWWRLWWYITVIAPAFGTVIVAWSVAIDDCIWTISVPYLSRLQYIQFKSDICSRLSLWRPSLKYLETKTISHPFWTP